MSKNDLSHKMDYYRYDMTNPGAPRERLGWVDLSRALWRLSDDGYEKLLRFGPADFRIAVFDKDIDAAFMLWRGWSELDECDVDLFLSLQRLYAPATPLSDRTVADPLAAWFNSGVGAATPQ